VTWANIYNKEFKIQPQLKSTNVQRSQTANILELEDNRQGEAQNVDINFHDGVELDDEALSRIANLAQVPRGEMEIHENQIRVKVKHEILAALAAVDGVCSIQGVHKMTTYNNKAREILKVEEVSLATGQSYHGDGQVVAVADTGFDKGSTTDTLPAFKDRVLKLWAYGRPGLTDDPDGHGTHVSGSVLGDGVSKKLGGKIQGTAPKAKLALQSLGSNEIDEDGKPFIGLGGIPSNLNALFIEPYNDSKVKARIHSNSWGPRDRSLPYAQARQIDEFVWTNPDMVICFAAGNEGADIKPTDGIIDGGEIGLYATAKNNITVGASENNRPDITTTFGDFTTESGKPKYPKLPLRTDRTADKPDGMAAFSNRGYTVDGRVKPDLVAPGTAVLSANSRHANVRVGQQLADPDWTFMWGTSMATPLVAGCAAVIREILIKEAGLDIIPAALVKAILINGAVELKGQYSPSEAGKSPNPSSGWGLVNLKASAVIAKTSELSGFVIGPDLSQGEDFDYTINVPFNLAPAPGDGDKNGGKTQPTSSIATGFDLKVTLVWTDPAGEFLQNDLDLIVVGSDGTEYHGNVGAGKGFDRVNNVEQVVWNNIPAGEVQVKVRAFRITVDDQPFALAWSLL
jgi:serine protease AprX